MHSRSLTLGVCLPIFACASFGHAQLQTQEVASDLFNAVFVTNAMDDSGRLFIVEQDGTIQILHPNGELGKFPFLNISSLVESGATERGLLGLAFHPEFSDPKSPGHNLFYVNYTAVEGGATHIAEFSVAPDNPDFAPQASERIIMVMEQPTANHNGGWIGFSPDDGYLYIAVGDGGPQNDPNNVAIDLTQYLGKMHRIDVNGGDDFPNDPDMNFRVPLDNPFIDHPGAIPSIWHYGLRNPWRSSFDRETGDLWIGDVGQWNWEEINHDIGNQGGAFYGWRCREGFEAIDESCNETNWTDPVHAYSHEGSRCAVTGGYVYRGCELGEAYRGKYFFTDYCVGFISTLDPQNGYHVTEEISVGFANSSFGEDQEGELYVVTLSGRKLFKIVNPSVTDGCDEPCIADYTGDGNLNFFDVSAFLSFFSSEDPLADLNSDGNFNFFDISTFLNAFAEGCP